MRRTEILMNKPVYLGLSILELGKILMYEFWYDYVKPKCEKRANLCYMDKDIFIVYIKADDIYKDIAEDVEARFDAFKTRFELDLIMNQKDHHKKEKNK